MIIKKTKTAQDLQQVLYDSSCGSERPVYWVFGDIGNPKWVNMTVIDYQPLGRECPKTHGHYHHTEDLETYKLISGDGIFLLQKQGNQVNEVETVFLVTLIPGEEITISPKWGHSWINIGDMPLVTFDNWRAGHIDADYQKIKDLHGMAYYVLKENGEIKIEVNKNYSNVPAIKTLGVREFNAYENATNH